METSAHSANGEPSPSSAPTNATANTMKTPPVNSSQLKTTSGSSISNQSSSSCKSSSSSSSRTSSSSTSGKKSKSTSDTDRDKSSGSGSGKSKNKNKSKSKSESKNESKKSPQTSDDPPHIPATSEGPSEPEDGARGSSPTNARNPTPTDNKQTSASGSRTDHQAEDALKENPPGQESPLEKRPTPEAAGDSEDAPVAPAPTTEGSAGSLPDSLAVLGDVSMDEHLSVLSNLPDRSGTSTGRGSEAGDGEEEARRVEPPPGAVLRRAALRGELDEVRSVLGVQPDGGAALLRWADRNGATALHHAAFHGRVEVGRFLVDAGASVDAQDADGCTPLHNAAYGRRRRMVQFLLQCGAAVDHCDLDESTPLMKAAFNDGARCVRLLLENGASVSAEDVEGVNAIQKCSFSNAADALKVLLEWEGGKEYINQPDQMGSTALHKAAFNGHIRSVRILLEASANPSAIDHEGANPLHHAAFNDHPECLLMLVRAGGDANKNTHRGFTPLHFAVRNGCTDCVLLLAEQAPSSVNLVDSRGRSPLHMAVAAADIAMVQALLRAGANARLRDKKGRVPLDHLSRRDPQRRALRKLLSRKASSQRSHSFAVDGSSAPPPLSLYKGQQSAADGPSSDRGTTSSSEKPLLREMTRSVSLQVQIPPHSASSVSSSERKPGAGRRSPTFSPRARQGIQSRGGSHLSVTPGVDGPAATRSASASSSDSSCGSSPRQPGERKRRSPRFPRSSPRRNTLSGGGGGHGMPAEAESERSAPKGTTHEPRDDAQRTRQRRRNEKRSSKLSKEAASSETRSHKKAKSKPKATLASTLSCSASSPELAQQLDDDGLSVSSPAQLEEGDDATETRLVSEPRAEFIDRYGFRHESAESALSDLPNDRRARARQAAAETSWRKVTTRWTHYQQKRRALQRMCERGIPRSMRGPAWRLFCRADEAREMGVFDQLTTQSGEHDEQIDRDISRTFPRHVLFADEKGHGQASLGRVLKAYAIHDPEVGYCQGMGFLVALLLMYMQEEDAFWCLVQICDAYEMRHIFRTGLPKVVECLYVFERLMHHFLPKLNAHLESEGIPSGMYAPQFFITLFLYNLPFPLALRFWDLFLLQGYDLVFNFALGLMKIFHDELLSFSFDSIMDVLGKLDKHTLNVDPDEFVRVSLSFKIKPALLSRLRADFETNMNR